SGGYTTIKSFQADGNWWTRHPFGLVDETATPGQSYQYRIELRDPFNNGGFSSGSTAVTIPADQEPDRFYFDRVVAAGARHLWRLGETSGTDAYDWIGSNDL